MLYKPICKACVGEHVSADESNVHKVVKFQKRKPNPLYPGSKLHGKDSILYLRVNDCCMKSEQPIQEAVILPPVTQFLHKAKIVSTIKIDFPFLFGPYFVAYLNDDKIWTGGAEDKMYIFSVNQSKLLRSVQTTSRKRPGGIAVTKHGDLVYTDPNDKRINTVKDETTDAITLENWRPFGVCTTSCGDLLVIMHSEKDERLKVVRYSGSTEKQTILLKERTSIYEHPVHNQYCISENKNLDICVVDINDKSVIVINQAGKLRFTYRGQTPSPKGYPFNPKGITTDSRSQILTADYDNDCVHIINQDGKFLCFINRGLRHPFGLCIDTNDNLFVSEMRYNQVKKIKYQH
ncbi:uncharacterized protein LOC133195309 [Saccostrea echinata]|uniref:uncharacterized protein LOC133195309 n=1 Tax=Saccostrea echinata TaxID=191078 RepID=UPI002A8141E0|nr:uncharacterized protein LOC133195309 [Saccostrea echinata]